MVVERSNGCQLIKSLQICYFWIRITKFYFNGLEMRSIPPNQLFRLEDNMLDYIKAFLYSKGILTSKKGQGLVEYAILIIIIAAAALIAANIANGKIAALYTGMNFATK
jgi:hypothetical protein